MGIFSRRAADDDKSVESMRETIMYNIWLAGLGAYAKSAEEVNEISSRGRSVFEDLLERGRTIEKQQKECLYTSRSQAAVEMEERFHQVVQKVIGIDSFKLNNVDDKLDRLTAQVELLLKQSSSLEENEPDATTSTSASAVKASTSKPRSTSGVARRKTAASKGKATASEEQTANKPARKSKAATTEKAE